jgi:hypothetical protein
VPAWIKATTKPGLPLQSLINDILAKEVPLGGAGSKLIRPAQVAITDQDRLEVLARGTG